MKRADGKVALVTGAGSGIGRATAVALAGEGADVIVADDDLSGAEETRRLIAEAGGRSEVVVFADDVAANVEAARALGWRGVWFRSTDQAIGEIEAALKK